MQPFPFDPSAVAEKQTSVQAGIVAILCDVEGIYNCFDVWVEAPAAWATSPVRLNIFAWHKGSRQLVMFVDLSQLGISPFASRVSGLVARVRGVACEKLTVESDGSTQAGALGFVRVVAWGNSSYAAPEHQLCESFAGQILAEGSVEIRQGSLAIPEPIRQAMLFAWDGTNNNRMVLLSADGNGHLKTIGVGSAGAAYAQGLTGPFGAGQFPNILDAIAVGRFNSPDLVLAAGQGSELQLTSAAFLRGAEQFAPGYEDNANAIAATVPKPLAANTYAPSKDVNLGAVNARAIKASAGNIFEVFWDNNNAAAQFLLFVDKATAPVLNDVPILAIRMPATSSGQFQIAMPLNFATGIAACISTTRNAVTLGAAADIAWTVLYK